MSSYGSAHSGQLHPGYQAQPQQRARSYSNPPYPTTPGSAPYPQQASYFPPQMAPTSNPIVIPTANRKHASPGYAYVDGTSPSHPHASSPYVNSYPTQHLQPIPQQQPIPEQYQSSPQQHPIMATSPTYSHHRRSSSSHHGYDPRHSYESAHSYQSAQSHHGHPSPDYYARHSQGRRSFGNENVGVGQAGVLQPLPAHAAPEPPKGYGDWDEDEVERYNKNRDLERRPTLGGSLMSFVKKIGGSDRR